MIIFDKSHKDTFIEEVIQLANKYKGVHHHLPFKKSTLRPWWDITVHPQEWLKLKILTPPGAGKDAEKLDQWYIVGGN